MGAATTQNLNMVELSRVLISSVLLWGRVLELD